MYIKADLYIKPKRMSTGEGGQVQRTFCFDSVYKQMLQTFDIRFGQFRQKRGYQDDHFHYTFTDRETDLSEIIRLLETYREKAYIKLRFLRVYEEGEEGREISLLNSSKEFYCYEGKSDSASDFFGANSFENKPTADLQSEEQDFLFKSCSFMKNPALKKTVCSSCSKKALCTCVCPGKKLRGGNRQRTASSLSAENCSAGNERTYVSRRELRFAEDTKVGIDPYYGKKHIMIRKLIFNLLSEYGPKFGSFESSDFCEENFISEKQQAAREE